MELVDRAKQGLLSRDELDAVAARLRDQSNFDHALDQILVMMFGGDARYRLAVERYLTFRGNLEVARFALETLCTYWQLTDDYLDWVAAFAQGIDWDCSWGGSVVRPLTLMIAGFYLSTRPSHRLLQLLIRIAEDETEKVEARLDAAGALVNSLGFPPGQGPRDLALDNERFRWVLERSKARLETEREPPPGPSRAHPPHRIDLPDYVDAYIAPHELNSSQIVQARKGETSAHELDAIARRLPHEQDLERVRAALLIMLFAGDSRYQTVVERYTELPQDPRIAVPAVLALCASWRLTAEYVDLLTSWMTRSDKDDQGMGNSLQQVAFTIAGNYLARRRSRRLLEALLSLAEDEGKLERVRSEAARALHVAYGAPADMIPHELQPGDQNFLWALETTRERLQSE
jgi:hypothetical protein